MGMDANFFTRKVDSLNKFQTINKNSSTYETWLPTSVRKDFFYCFYFLRRMKNYSLLEPGSGLEYAYGRLKAIVEDGLLHATNGFGVYLIPQEVWTLRKSPDEQLARLEMYSKNIDPG